MNAKKLGLILIAGGLLSASVVAVGGDDERGGGWTFTKKGRAPDVAPVNNTLYRSECGTCHYAFPPGFLPARSWNKLMADLSDHFGENAELDPDTLQALTEYLVANSADKVQTRRSIKFMESIPANSTPLRISEVPYFVREHNEIPARLIKGNPKVGSLSNCVACHTRAEAGSFAEREIDIPGYGRWED